METRRKEDEEYSALINLTEIQTNMKVEWKPREEESGRGVGDTLL